jgi:hypothetical protein
MIHTCALGLHNFVTSLTAIAAHGAPVFTDWTETIFYVSVLYAVFSRIVVALPVFVLRCLWRGLVSSLTSLGVVALRFWERQIPDDGAQRNRRGHSFTRHEETWSAHAEQRQSRYPGARASAAAILGVAPDSQLDEIKHAFRCLLKRYHPDRFIHRTREEQELAARMPRTICTAYEEMCAQCP